MSIFRYIVHRLCSFEEFPYRGLVEKGHANDTEHIKSAPIKTEVMLNNSDKAISCNSRVNLDSDRVFGYTPERLNIKMLLDPFEEQLHLPSILIKQRDIFRANPKVVGKICEGSFVFHGVIADPAEQDWVFFPCLRPGKAYRLVVEDVIRTFKKFLSLNNFVLKFAPLPYYEVGSDEIYREEPGEIKISPVKDVVGVRFVGNLVHGVHVMDPGLRDMEKGRYLGNHIIEGMDLDATFGLAKARPPEKIETQVNSGGIKSIKPPSDLKFLGYPFFLCDGNHFVGKLLEYPVVPVRVRFREIAARYRGFAETQMVRLRGMGCNDADKFPEAITAGELSVHHDQQLVPATERLYVFISLKFHNNTLKRFLWKKLYQLRKHIFSAVHKQILLLCPKVKFQVVDILFLRYFASLQFVIRVK